MATLQLADRTKDKLRRPGDILGALTSEEGGLRGDQVGKIKVLARSAYVAVERSAVQKAQAKLERDKLKGHAFRVHHIRYFDARRLSLLLTVSISIQDHCS